MTTVDTFSVNRLIDAMTHTHKNLIHTIFTHTSALIMRAAHAHTLFVLLAESHFIPSQFKAHAERV